MNEELGDVVPTLKGLHGGVLIDPDWNIVSQKGYNAATQLYLTHDYSTPEIPETVTEDDIDTIKCMLWQIFKEFCFVDRRGEDSVDYHNTLAAFVSLAIRPMWEGALPILAISKKSTGCGGSMLSRIVGCLAMGSDMAPWPYQRAPGELKKTIDCVLMKDVRYCKLDHVPSGKNWVTPNLLASSTGTGEVTLRKFRTNKYITKDAYTMFAVNGTDLKISPGIARHVIPVRLAHNGRWYDAEYKLSEPELVSIAKELHPYAVWAVAVLHKYWVQKGKPAPHKCTGDISEYRDWYYEVCGMLEAAGYTHILDNLRDVQNGGREQNE